VTLEISVERSDKPVKNLQMKTENGKFSFKLVSCLYYFLIFFLACDYSKDMERILSKIKNYL
jgi:hypothetical protein